MYRPSFPDAPTIQTFFILITSPHWDTVVPFGKLRVRTAD
jgi:hypothetical protein